MTQLGQAQVGLLRSTPKLTRINGDDNLKVIWRNMGNNHAHPFFWGQTFTPVSGTVTMTLVNGVKFHGMELASYANVQVTPSFSSGDFYITKDTTANTIDLTWASAADGTNEFDVTFLLGASDPVIEGIYCSTWSAANIRADLP